MSKRYAMFAGYEIIQHDGICSGRSERRLTADNVLEYLMERRGPVDITGIRFGFNASHGRVHSESSVVRVLESLRRKGKVSTTSSGEWFSV